MCFKTAFGRSDTYDFESNVLNTQRDIIQNEQRRQDLLEQPIMFADAYPPQGDMAEKSTY